ncbi:MAG: exodeoxyribonuclease VII large subunit [Deltaproteobacteria bacterium]|nr:exodeoxyribonuclease VII large subunit [Deltaproteobacteria bacterium]
MPESPRHVGVVTSLSAAALFDALRTLLNRQPGLHVIVSPCPVQGADAPPQIADALATLDATGACDVILLVRGGGSPEDLWSFNDARVVEAIAACATPVVSGVGHEIDVTLADFAADLRAATPTAAAQAVTARWQDQAALLKTLTARSARLTAEFVQDTLRRVDDATAAAIASTVRTHRRARRDVAALHHRLVAGDPRRRAREGRRLVALWTRALVAITRRRMMTASEGLDRTASRNARGMIRVLNATRTDVEARARQLHDLSPTSILARGYAIARDPKTGRVAKKASDHAPGDRLDLLLHKGALSIEIKERKI